MKKLTLLGLNEAHPGYSPPLPLVSLEDFFDGNEDTESIAPNLISTDPTKNRHPGLNFLFSTLKEIRARPDVQDVLVEAFEIETALQGQDTWPFAEKIFFYTSAPRSEIETWNAQLRADGPIEFRDPKIHPNEPNLLPGNKAWYCVWD